MLKSTVLFISLLSLASCAFSQSSFFKVLEDNSTELSQFIAKSRIAVNDIGDVFYMHGDLDGVFKLAQLSNEGAFLNGSRISDNQNDTSLWFPLSLEAKGDWSIVRGVNYNITAGDGNAIFAVNAEMGTAWSKRTAVSFFSGQQAITIAENEEVYCSFFHTGTIFRAGIACLELETGHQKWGYSYRRMGAFNTGILFGDIKKRERGDISVLVTRHLTGLPFIKKAGLLKIDTSGNVIQNIDITIDSLTPFSHEMDEQSNIYIAGSIGSVIYPFDGRNGVIIKLDADYNFVWAKKMIAEQFNCKMLEINVFPNGDLIFSYVSNELLPVITGKISTDGELLWHKGYAFVGPNIAVGQDSSIYLASGLLFNEDGSFESEKNVIAKTDPNGNIAGCPQFDACLYLEDIEIELETVEWERWDAPFLPDIDISIEPLGYTVIDTCGVPAHPEATFYFPDTLCQHDCLAPSELKNSLANAVEWTIIGPGVDSVFLEESFDWCFDSVGVYTIEQEIWLLGCSEFFSQSITILADNLDLSLGEDSFICQDAPYVLSATASRPLQGFQWSNASNNTTITVSLPADYSLTATDGYCVDSAMVSLRLIDDILDEDPLVIPTDTTLCPDFLPYELRPSSIYSTVFFLNEDNLFADSVFKLTQEGVYTIKTQVENCVFSENFELTLEDCAAPIYIANTFSPNNDGINDQVSPQGIGFEGIKLTVFNRWGDLVFETHEAPFSWGGSFDNELLGSGVYVLVFTYLNQRNLQEEVLSQDVLLLR